jgi:hypothetical protein
LDDEYDDGEKLFERERFHNTRACCLPLHMRHFKKKHATIPALASRECFLDSFSMAVGFVEEWHCLYSEWQHKNDRNALASLARGKQFAKAVRKRTCNELNLRHIDKGGWDMRKGIAPIAVANHVKLRHALEDAIPLAKLILPMPKLALCDGERALAIEDGSPLPAEIKETLPGPEAIPNVATFSGVGLNPLFQLANEKLRATKLLKGGRTLTPGEVTGCFREASEDFAAFSPDQRERQLERYRHEVALRRAFGPMYDKMDAVQEASFEPQFGRGGTYSAPIAASEVMAEKADTGIPKVSEIDDDEFTVFRADAVKARERLRGNSPTPNATHHRSSNCAHLSQFL